MGVPKFYRWISERYPCLSEVVKENQIPEFDNLYLDMNGIIHTCSHPNDDDPHFRITEDKIFEDIFHYLECLYRIIRPKRTFFIAVDGVAPRAKMNQQRGRRFMSALNALNLAEQAKQRGEILPTEDRFDSNCITPGTEFMTRLHSQLQYFIRFKISTDEAWRGIQIYLSGHDVPGEGEHKIMDFIRYSRSQLDYDPNTRHCLYGLDADLMMLGLCSHEPHFSLLREEVKFIRPSKKQKSRTVDPEETTFHLLHLSLFREYLDLEFSELKEKISFSYDLEKIIDDWVLMGFLVGNDFIPHLPHLHIHEGALPMVYDVYKKTMPTLDGYMNEGGVLNLPRFEKFLVCLSQFDRDHFGDEYSDMKYLESKTFKEIVEDKMRDIRTITEPEKSRRKSKRPKGTDIKDFDLLTENANDELKALLAEQAKEFNPEFNDCETAFSAFESHNPFGVVDPNVNKDEKEYVKPPEPVVGDEIHVVVDEDPNSDSGKVLILDPFYDGFENYDSSPDEDEWSPELERAFLDHKRLYYQNKLEYEHVTSDVLREQAIGYITAIQWNLHYYYNGCVSWSWYYKHHYSPYLSDIIGFSDLKINFDMGEPFLPFQQLLAVLPSQSKKLLPAAYQSLMTSESSPIVDYYPTTVQTDLNGKKQDWEAVVLIPFIDEKRLLDAMKQYNAALTEDERRRNAFGETLLFIGQKSVPKTQSSLFPSSLPGVFPDITNDISECLKLSRTCFHMDRNMIKKGLLPNVKIDVFFPGFPTFKHIPITHELKNIDVKVFQANSRNPSRVLKLDKRQEFADLLQSEPEKLADRLVGREIYVNWPYLTLGLCGSFVTRDNVYTKDPDKRLKIRRADLEHFERHEQNIRLRYFNTKAIDIADIGAIVYVRPLIGTRYIVDKHGRTKLDKEFAELTIPYVLETTIETQYVRRELMPEIDSIPQLFPDGSLVYLLSSVFYGCCGRIVADNSALDNNKLRIRRETSPERDMKALMKHKNLCLNSDSKKKKMLAVNPRVLYRPCLSTGNIVPDRETEFRLYDRVVNVRDGIAVPLGLRGTVVNIFVGYRDQQNNRQNGTLFSYDFKVDVEFDEEFLGGKAYHGVAKAGNNSTAKKNGYRMPPGALINLTHGFRMEFDKYNANRCEKGQHPITLSDLSIAEVPKNPIKLNDNQASIVKKQKETKLPIQKSKSFAARDSDRPGPSNVQPTSTRFAQPACYVPPASTDLDRNLTKNPKQLFERIGHGRKTAPIENQTKAPPSSTDVHAALDLIFGQYDSKRTKDRIKLNETLKKTNNNSTTGTEQPVAVKSKKHRQKYEGPQSVAEFFQRSRISVAVDERKESEVSGKTFDLKILGQSLPEPTTMTGDARMMELPIKHLFDQNVKSQNKFYPLKDGANMKNLVLDKQKTRELKNLLKIGTDTNADNGTDTVNQNQELLFEPPTVNTSAERNEALKELFQSSNLPVHKKYDTASYSSAFAPLPHKSNFEVPLLPPPPQQQQAQFWLPHSTAMPPPQQNINYRPPMMEKSQAAPRSIQFFMQPQQLFHSQINAGYQQRCPTYPMVPNQLPSQHQLPMLLNQHQQYFQPIQQAKDSTVNGNKQTMAIRHGVNLPPQPDYPMFVPMQVTRNQPAPAYMSQPQKRQPIPTYTVVQSPPKVQAAIGPLANRPVMPMSAPTNQSQEPPNARMPRAKSRLAIKFNKD